MGGLRRASSAQLPSVERRWTVTRPLSGYRPSSPGSPVASLAPSADSERAPAEIVVGAGRGRLDEGLEAPLGVRAAVGVGGAGVAPAVVFQRVLVARAAQGEHAGGRAVLEGRAHRQRGAVAGQREGGAERVAAAGVGRLEEGLERPGAVVFRAAVDGDGTGVAPAVAVQRGLVARAARGERAGGRAVLAIRAHRQRGAVGGQREGEAELVAAAGVGRLEVAGGGDRTGLLQRPLSAARRHADVRVVAGLDQVGAQPPRKQVHGHREPRRLRTGRQALEARDRREAGARGVLEGDPEMVRGAAVVAQPEGQGLDAAGHERAEHGGRKAFTGHHRGDVACRIPRAVARRTHPPIEGVRDGGVGGVRGSVRGHRHRHRARPRPCGGRPQLERGLDRRVGAERAGRQCADVGIRPARARQPARQRPAGERVAAGRDGRQRRRGQDADGEALRETGTDRLRAVAADFDGHRAVGAGGDRQGVQDDEGGPDRRVGGDRAGRQHTGIGLCP